MSTAALPVIRNMRLMRRPRDEHEWAAMMREMAGFCPSLNIVTYSASMTPDMRLGDWVRITATNNTAFTINAPKNGYVGQPLTVMLRNTSGGALGAATWNAVFKWQGGAAIANPANGFSKSVHFRYDGTNWVEVGRTAADVAN